MDIRLCSHFTVPLASQNNETVWSTDGPGYPSLIRKTHGTLCRYQYLSVFIEDTDTYLVRYIFLL